jgi:hypothetical protein
MTLSSTLQTEAKLWWGVCKELGSAVFLLVNFLRCSHRLLFPNPWRRVQEQRLQNALTYMPAMCVARKGGELGRNTTRLKLWRYTDMELNQLAYEVSRMCRTCYARRTIYVMGGCDCNLRDLMRRMREVCKRDGLTATLSSMRSRESRNFTFHSKPLRVCFIY